MPGRGRAEHSHPFGDEGGLWGSAGCGVQGLGVLGQLQEVRMGLSCLISTVLPSLVPL